MSSFGIAIPLISASPFMPFVKSSTNCAACCS
nr:MAG TPA: DHC, diheme cytochrome c cytochrome, cytochrome c551.5, electron [Crassvirales sp.]